MSADMDMLDITEMAPEQIRKSLRNAAEAFVWPVGTNVLNLIAIDCNLYDDIDICDAVFGTEFSRIGQRGHSWSREPNGFFLLNTPVENVAGVLSLRSVERSPVSDYLVRCFINEHYKERAAEIEALMPMEKTVHYNMTTKMGEGMFE